MRVLVVTQDFPPARGGIQLLMQRLASNLHGVEPRVLTIGSAEAPGFDAESSLDVVRVGHTGSHHRPDIMRLNRATVWQAARWRPRVVISAHVKTAPAAALVGAPGRIKTVQYLHGDEFRYRPGLVRLATRRSDALIAVSRHTLDMAREAGADPGRLHLVHPGVDPPPPRREERAQRPTIVTVARLVDRYKGHDTMIRALPRIRSRVPDVEWVVVGDGALRPWLEDLARSTGVADAVRFVGEVPDAERDAWMSRAHVFAMASRLPDEGLGGEGFGIAYLEASSWGLPVVGPDIAGPRDAVLDGETGVLVDPTDHMAVAEATAGLLLDPKRAEALGSAGTVHAAAFTWRRHAAAVEALIHGLTGE